MKTLRILVAASLLLTLMPTAEADGHELPPTVYEQAGLEIPPQAMDYDEENLLFPAHPGWLNDKLIHYYKFRMYVPGNYDTAGWGPDDVPIMPLYLPTTADEGASNADALAAVPLGQYPLLDQFPVAGNTDYSDFQHIVFVHVAEGYRNDHRDLDGLMAAGYPTSDSGIIANVPVVPESSQLEDPSPERDFAPIRGWPAWYDGLQAQTFVFETNSQAFADYINPRTRVAPFDEEGSGYEAVVASDWASPEAIQFIPIWHVNQYFTGVTEGVNNGGPAAAGQRNVIGKDRLDDGYSPLWQVFWATQLPVGYQADDASHPLQYGTPGNEANGFKLAGTPMLVNCPNIGPHGGGASNTHKAGAFDAPSADEEVTVEGSLIMAGGAEVEIRVNGEAHGTVTTGMMGAYQYTVPASALDQATNTIEAVSVAAAGPHGAGDIVATWTVHGEPSEDAGAGFIPFVVLALLAAVIIAFVRSGR